MCVGYSAVAFSLTLWTCRVCAYLCLRVCVCACVIREEQNVTRLPFLLGGGFFFLRIFKFFCLFVILFFLPLASSVQNSAVSLPSVSIQRSTG